MEQVTALLAAFLSVQVIHTGWIIWFTWTWRERTLAAITTTTTTTKPTRTTRTQHRTGKLVVKSSPELRT